MKVFRDGFLLFGCIAVDGIVDLKQNYICLFNSTGIGGSENQQYAFQIVSRLSFSLYDAFLGN